MRKKTGSITVELRIDRNPPVIAKNRITIEIKDARGNYLTDAKVLVNYYMPPMPGMPPMNYTTKANLSGHEYRAVMDLIMTGPWNIIVKVLSGGKRFSVTFPIDVR